MATCNPQTLLDSANCYTGYSVRDMLVMEVQMLCNLLDKIENGGAVTCDPQELLTQAVCFWTIPDGELQAIKLQLLCEISTAL